MRDRTQTKTAVIPDLLINQVGERLAEGKPLRRVLPLEGRLHIDRTLPFLVVYRRPHSGADEGTHRLVKGEASYLVASGGRKLKPSLTELVRTIAETLAGKCKGFLIIEIWSGLEDRINDNLDPSVAKAAFRIITSKVRTPTSTVEALEDALKRIRMNRQSASVEVVHAKHRSPLGLEPLLSSADAKKINCFIIGLEIYPVYRHPGTGDLFPLSLRKLHSGLARALKKAVFVFSHSQTRLRPENYQALGRRAVTKTVWDVDHRLADISNQFDFLLLVTPVNVDKAWAKFKKEHCEQAPVFYYRPRPVDPALLKRRLYEIPIERVEDPTLAFLFREKRAELDRQLTMLGDLGTRRFLYGSLLLFGPIGDDLVQLSKILLQSTPPHSHDDSRGGYLNAAAFAERAERELDFYRSAYSGAPAEVQVRDDTVGLMVSRGNLLIGRTTKMPSSRVEALLQHEVGTHIVTYLNGRAQPFKQLYCGLAGYEELQEGLAVLAEYLVGGLSRPRLRMLAGRVVAAHCLVDGAPFIETFRVLNRTHGFTQRTAFTITARLYRGGGLTKDIIYLRGLTQLLDYLRNGGELDPLFVGKISAEHIQIIQELQWRKVLQTAPIRPRYLMNAQTDEKLKRLKDGLSVLDLIGRKR